MKFKMALLVVVLLLVTSLEGQIIYPVNVTIGWDKNPAVEQVIDYTLVHNNGTSNQSFTITDASCTHAISDGQCRQTISITGAAAQTVSVTARNMWASSTPEVVTFTVTAPGKARNIKIRSGS